MLCPEMLLTHSMLSFLVRGTLSSWGFPLWCRAVPAWGDGKMWVKEVVGLPSLLVWLFSGPLFHWVTEVPKVDSRALSEPFLFVGSFLIIDLGWGMGARVSYSLILVTSLIPSTLEFGASLGLPYWHPLHLSLFPNASSGLQLPSLCFFFSFSVKIFHTFSIFWHASWIANFSHLVYSCGFILLYLLLSSEWNLGRKEQ